MNKKLLVIVIIYVAYLIIPWAAYSQSPIEFEAVLSGANSFPVATTKGNGMINLTLNGDQLVVTGSFEKLSSDYLASHIHLGMAGENGMVEIPLDPTLNADMKSGTYEAAKNTFTLSATEISAMENRQLYVNIHSQTYKSGEIRGQILPKSDAYFRANLSGNNEIPAVSLHAHGSVVAELRGDSLIISGSFSGLNSSFQMAHIHLGYQGENGNVILPLTVQTSSGNMMGDIMASDNAFKLTSGQKDSLMARLFYVNVHSSDHMGGAIRGQMVNAASTVFIANLAGSNEVKPVNSKAAGSVVLELNGDTLWVCGSFTGLSSAVATNIAGGAHIHGGLPGFNGGIQHKLNATFDTDMMGGVFEVANNRFVLSSAGVDSLMNRMDYVNVHTMNYNGGELRAQALAEATSYFFANLMGSNEVQPLNVPGMGALNLELNDTTLYVIGGFQGLMSSFNVNIAGGAHLHKGAIDANGGIEIGLTTDLATNDTTGSYKVADNSYALSNIQIVDLYDEMMYANIHSMDHASGELRGQVLSAPDMFPDSSMILSPADGAMVTLSGKYSDAFTVTWKDISDPNGDVLAYIWQVSPDSTFSTVLVNVNVGDNTSASFTYGALDTLLADAGVGSGASVMIYHLVLSSDGSLQTPSEALKATFERGTLIPIESNPLNTKPYKLSLNQNYPNPFNPSTNISFSLDKTGMTTLTVYNMLGQRVATIINKQLSAGSHSVTFNANSLSSGLYIYKLDANGRTFTRKMMLIK